jgi:5'-methylthioadenosine phosphorylase
VANKEAGVSTTAEARVGVIGGSGFDIEGFTDVREVRLDTPFGDPSSAYHVGEFGGTSVAFLARHGKDHEIPPHQLPSRANIHGLKQLGVERVIAISAVGSLAEAIEPRHLVVPDQLWDRTIRPNKTFFEDGMVAHVPFGEPFCPDLRSRLVEAARVTDTIVHDGGTYVCMEGPQFSTRFESQWHQKMGATIVGMTASPEAKLAREAGLCYAILALSTDYDAWREEHDDVDVGMILENMQFNGERARQTLAGLIPTLGSTPACGCAQAFEGAIVTPLEAVPAATLRKIDLLIKPGEQ